MQKDLKVINETKFSPVNYVIDIADWTHNAVEKVYEYTIAHNKNLAKENIDVKFYDGNEIASVGYDFVDNNSIKIYSKTNTVVVAVLGEPVEMQTGNDTNYTNYYTKGEADVTTRAIENAMNELDGEMSTTQSEMIEMEKRLTENDAKQFIEIEGTRSVKADDTLNGYAKDVKVNGNTLVNLGTKGIKDNANSLLLLPNFRSCYKKNTNYTFIVNIKSKSGTNLDGSVLRVDMADGTSWQPSSNFKYPLGVSIFKFASTPVELHPENTPWALWFRSPQSDWMVDAEVLILEGDWTNKPLPDYFEGMKSVGENGLVSVRTCGKNLFDHNNLEDFETIGEGVVVSENGEITFPNVQYRGFNYIKKLKPSKKYLICIEALEGDIDGSSIELWTTVSECAFEGVGRISLNGSHTYKISATSKSNLDNARLTLRAFNQGTNVVKFKLMISETDNISTEFAPYEESVVQVQLPASVDGLKATKSIGDSFELGSGIVNEKCVEIVFTGEEVVSLYTNNDEIFHSFIVRIPSIKTLKPNTSLDTRFNKRIELLNWNLSNHIYMRIPIVDLDTVDVIGCKSLFKKWNDEGCPLKIIHQLETPIIHEIPAQHLSTFKEVTHMSVEDILPTTFSAKVPVSTPKVMKRLQEENRVLKENATKEVASLERADLEMLESNLELDFRLMDLEMALGTPLTGMGLRAMSPYDMMKKLIINGRYETEDMTYKISVYLDRGRVTQEEADELHMLMTIFPPAY